MKHGIKKKRSAMFTVLLAGVMAVNAGSSVYAGDMESFMAEDSLEVTASTEVFLEDGQTDSVTELPLEPGKSGLTGELTSESGQPGSTGELPSEPSWPEQTTDVWSEAVQSETAMDLFADQPQADTLWESAESEDVPAFEAGLTVYSRLGECFLEAAEDSQAFVKALFTEEETASGNRGNAALYADLVQDLLKEEDAKEDAQKLSKEERSRIEKEQILLKQWMEQNGYEERSCFVLRLKKGLEGEAFTRVYQTKNSLALQLGVGAWQSGEAGETVLLSVRDGQSVICERADSLTGMITFRCSIFSTYAVAYKADLPEEELFPSIQEHPAEPEFGSEPEVETETEPEPDQEVKPETEPEPDQEVKPETETESSQEVKPETESEPSQEVKPETEPEPQPEENPEAEPEVKPEPKITLEIMGDEVVYQPGSRGRWNPATHRYENAASGQWNFGEKGQKVLLRNDGTADAALILRYLPAEGYGQITGYFTDIDGNPMEEVTLFAGSSAEAYLHLLGEPEGPLKDDTIGRVIYSLAKED